MSNIHLFEKPGAGQHLAQTAIFKQIWMLSDKKSFVSGLFLREFMSTELAYNCFAHVLAKGLNQFPYFKYYARNIVLLTPGEHALLDQGTEEARISYALDVKSANWQPLYDLRDDLKKEYEKVFPSRRGLIIGYKYSPEEVVAKIGMLNKKYFESIIKDKKKGR